MTFRILKHTAVTYSVPLRVEDVIAALQMSGLDISSEAKVFVRHDRGETELNERSAIVIRWTDQQVSEEER